MVNTADNSAFFPDQTLVRLSDALDEVKTRAEDLDGVSEGTQHALETLVQQLERDISAEQTARMRGHQSVRLFEGMASFDPRSAFTYRLSEDGVVDADGDEASDDLEALAHDAEVLAIAASELAGHGLLSDSTRQLAQHAARSLNRDLEAALSPETVQASEQDENPDLWPDADRIARRRYGTSLDRIRLTDPELMGRLLHEAADNRRRR